MENESERLHGPIQRIVSMDRITGGANTDAIKTETGACTGLPTGCTGASSTSGTREDGSPGDSHEVETLWVNKAIQEVNRVRPKSQSPVPCTTIFRVPKHIRQWDTQAYEPLIIPIGPYHHDPSQESAMREYKWRCVRYLLSRHKSPGHAKHLLVECLSGLKVLDVQVRSCYSEDFPRLNAHKMAELMLLDGCFIIHLLLKHAKRERKEEEKRREVVLEVNKERKEEGQMMPGKEKQEEEQGSGLDSGKGVRRMQSDWKKKGKEPELELQMSEAEEELEGPFAAGLLTAQLVLHDLLKIENQIPFFVIKFLFDVLKTADDRGIDLSECALQPFRNIHPNESKSFKTSSVGRIHHLLHLFYSSRVSSQKSRQGNAWCAAAPAPKRIPSATELCRAGVMFRKKNEADSFLDITFKHGKIEIPPLRVYEYTSSLFCNLITFEQCYFDTMMTSVTIYAVFMDCILEKAKDVDLLRLRNILISRLSTDEALAGLFKRLCNQICYAAADGNHHLYLFEEVNKFYDSNFRKWRAELRRDYFSEPWTMVSVMQALILLALTMEQTLFSALSYYHPRNGS